MLRSILIATALLLSFSIHAQRATNQYIKDFIQEHRQGQENFAVKIPSWLIGLTGSIGVMASSEEEEKAAFRLAKEVGTSRVLVFNRADYPAPGQTVENFLHALDSYHGYERWAEVRAQSGERVRLSVRYRKETITDLAIAVEEEEQVVLVLAKADLSAKELGQLLKEIEAK